MSNPYAPPTAEDRNDPPALSAPPARHWFWRVYAPAFATYAGWEFFLILGWPASVDVYARDLALCLVAIGLLGYAFTRRLLWRGLWRFVWWLLPLAELISFLITMTTASEIDLGPGVSVSPQIPLTWLLLPPACVAAYRYSRSPLWSPR
jgi:hypothetical protein